MNRGSDLWRREKLGGVKKREKVKKNWIKRIRVVAIKTFLFMYNEYSQAFEELVMKSPQKSEGDSNRLIEAGNEVVRAQRTEISHNASSHHPLKVEGKMTESLCIHVLLFILCNLVKHNIHNDLK